MADAIWIENMKRIVLQAMEAGAPCNLMTGVVVSVDPPAVQLDRKIILKKNQLLVPGRLTDHTERMILPELGEVEAKVKSGLKAGEKVLLLQKKGGQQYLVLDRL